MRAGLLVLSLAAATAAHAQTQPATAPEADAAVDLFPAANAVAGRFTLETTALRRWTNDAGETVLQSIGEMTLTIGDATAIGQRGMIWIEPEVGGMRRVTAVLLGGARVVRGEITREGPRLVVVGQINANQVDITAETIDQTPDAGSTLLETATALRPAAPPTTQPQPKARVTARPTSPISLRAAVVRTVPAGDGTIAAMAEGGVFVIQRQPDGTLVELSADRAVLFGTETDMASLFAGPRNDVEEEAQFQSAYLEGDVRVRLLPGGGEVDDEQRLFADRVFFSFTDNQALLTEAILYTSEPSQNLPITLRAQTMRRLADGDYEATRAELSTSSLASPVYSLNARKVYLRQRQTDTGRDQTTVLAKDVTVRSFGTPLLYLPAVGANLSQGGFPVRGVSVGNSSAFGTELSLELGLFETFGKEPPGGLDASYTLQYLTDRGPALGFNSRWSGTVDNDAGLAPHSFRGSLGAYVIHDSGDDRLGGDRGRPEHDDELRGRVLFQQQHFNLPMNDWYLQYRLGYVSDDTFLEQYFPREFDNDLPHEASFYLARYRGDEVFWLTGNAALQSFVTSNENIAELHAVERMPEAGYDVYGRPLGTSGVNLISQNRLGGLRFNQSEEVPADYGFRNIGSTEDDDGFRGIPATGYTRPLNGLSMPEVPGRVTLRGDTRQQIDFPLKAGAVNMVPFVVGRMTAYDNALDNTGVLRAFAGGGVRVATQFARTYDHIASELLDIHRLRHVIEPSAQVFGGVTNIERSELDIFDQEVDGITDLTVLSLGLRNRVQTKRGGPGRWRSVDAFVLDTQLNLYGNEAEEPAALFNGAPIDAGSFRSIYFATAPEASYARDGVNASALWRVSDTTALLADAAYNLTDETLATVAAGVTAQRGDRLTYYLGGRYLGELNNTTLTAAMEYEISSRYRVTLQQNYRFDEDDPLSTNLLLTRRFDRVQAVVEVFFDQIEDEGGIRVGIMPIDLGGALDPFSFFQ